jgi:hypothetical protein
LSAFLKVDLQENFPALKVAKNEKGGGLSGINRLAFNSSTFLLILKIVLKDPGPLNSKKPI